MKYNFDSEKEANKFIANIFNLNEIKKFAKDKFNIDLPDCDKDYDKDK